MPDEPPTCWSCGLPQPPDYRQSLHLETCPDHDEETCLACIQLEDEDKQ